MGTFTESRYRKEAGVAGVDGQEVKWKETQSEGQWGSACIRLCGKKLDFTENEMG